MQLTFELTPQQMAELTRAVADELRRNPVNTVSRPVSVEEFCAATGMSKPTVYRRINAGEIRIVMGMGRRLIPASELERFCS